jgi:N-acetylmuramoyl-L-alanine amidase
MAYDITRDYIRHGNARSGEEIQGVHFIVAHDTGNPGSDAYDNRAYFDVHQPSASAHTFIDDADILEIVPLSEKAWHVRYEVSADNRLYDANSNDAAVGAELCWGGDIDFWEAYARYVWYIAYLCKKYKLNPRADIVAHSRLDPSRRSDPQNALNRYGISWNEFINDVAETNGGGHVDVNEKVKGVTIIRLIDEGDRGPAVKKAQKLLKALGYYGGNIDEIFGPKTKSAVRSFQHDQKIQVDGIIGPVTGKHLQQATEKAKPADQYNLDAIIPYPGRYIEHGSRGKDVKRVQRAVGVRPDGIYGPVTKAAIKAYQRRHGLAVDGIVGPETWNMMF